MMSDERLAEIHHIVDTTNDFYGSRLARELLAEVERLRAREAALVKVAVHVAELDSQGESLCYCWRELAHGHHDTCWVLKAHIEAHTTPSGEMDG